MSEGSKIMIVEDDAVAAKSLAASLTLLGYDVVAVTDTAQSAIECAGSAQPDLILMDVTLNDSIDGIAAAIAINTRLDVPIIFLTACTDDATFDRAKEADAFGYLSKPIDINQLSHCLELALHKHAYESALKRMENTVRLSEQKHRALLTAIPDLILRCRRDGTVLDCNIPHTHEFDFLPSDMTGSNITTLLNSSELRKSSDQIRYWLNSDECKHICLKIFVNGSARYFGHP